MTTVKNQHYTPFQSDITTPEHRSELTDAQRRPINGTKTNSGGPGQMPQYAASVKGLHYLRMSNGYVTTDEIKMLHKLYQKLFNRRVQWTQMG